jgi:hypothetical protein
MTERSESWSFSEMLSRRETKMTERSESWSFSEMLSRRETRA